MVLAVVGRNKAENVLVTERCGNLAVYGDEVVAGLRKVSGAARHCRECAEVAVGFGKAYRSIRRLRRRARVRLAGSIFFGRSRLLRRNAAQRAAECDGKDDD